jgi:hydroxybutyrate-dimer hydrolase
MVGILSITNIFYCNAIIRPEPYDSTSLVEVPEEGTKMHSRKNMVTLLIATFGSINAVAANDIVVGPVLHRIYDGDKDDLLTAGIGIDNLVSKKIPASYSDPLRPTADEIRRQLLAVTDAPHNGFGKTYGPNIDAGTEKLAEGAAKLAGDEYRTYVRTGPGYSTALVQIPSTFSASKPCILAISTAGTSDVLMELNKFGYWGLVRGCAVAWSDKGAGAGVEILKDAKALNIEGLLQATDKAAEQAKFVTSISSADRQKIVADRPGLAAYKWAHAGWSNEEYAGDALLNTIRFSFDILNSHLKLPADTINAGNSVVIASGHSGGGGGAIQAGERDTEGLIDGIVARAPQTQTFADDRISITRKGTTVRATAKDLADYFSFADLYRACAILALPNDPARQKLVQAGDRCTSLASAGLLASTGVEAQAQEALEKLHSYGFAPELDPFIGATALFDTYTYGLVSQYGGFRVEEGLCSYSISPVSETGKPIDFSAELLSGLGYLSRGGKPDGTKIALVNDADPAGPTKSAVSTSASTKRKDYNFDGVKCLREAAFSPRVKNTLARLMMHGNLHRKPTIIIQGQLDEILPVDMVVRPYVALNSLVEGKDSRVTYLEVPLATHGDPGSDSRSTYVPWGIYHIRSLELMWNNLTKGTALPPSQVIRVSYSEDSRSKNPATPEVTSPSILLDPSAADRIVINGGDILIPN